MKIGNAIKLCRVQRKLSQGDLATLAGISVSYLSLIERDKRDPNFSTIERIAKALDVPLSILVFLAMDRVELKEMSKELAEKLAYTSLSLVKALDDPSTAV